MTAFAAGRHNQFRLQFLRGYEKGQRLTGVLRVDVIDRRPLSVRRYDEPLDPAVEFDAKDGFPVAWSNFRDDFRYDLCVLARDDDRLSSGEARNRFGNPFPFELNIDRGESYGGGGSCGGSEGLDLEACELRSGVVRSN